MESNWMNKQVSLYRTHVDTTGQATSYYDIFNRHATKDLTILTALKQLDRTAFDYKLQKSNLKAKLQCYTPAALLGSRASGHLNVIHRTGIMQLDFDDQDIREYDLQELKHAVFALPFIGYCGTSCSGDGFYALALIAEPERLKEYAEHCFQILKCYDIKPDESKGKKPEDLRYVSIDMKLVRPNPEPLRIKQFMAKEAPKKLYTPTYIDIKRGSNKGRVNNMVDAISKAYVGNRWATVQQAAYTLGGLQDQSNLNYLIDAIHNNSSFKGEESKYIKCAQDCFSAGWQKPFK